MPAYLLGKTPEAAMAAAFEKLGRIVFELGWRAFPKAVTVSWSIHERRDVPGTLQESLAHTAEETGYCLEPELEE